MRVTECVAVLRAEDLYTDLLRDDPNRVKAGAHGDVTWTLEGRTESLRLSFEVRANAVWHFGAWLEFDPNRPAPDESALNQD